VVSRFGSSGHQLIRAQSWLSGGFDMKVGDLEEPLNFEELDL
jgi:hypothetical protein